MKNTSLERFGRTVNDMCINLPKGRSRCFDIGIWGGCGVDCGAFIDGECEEPQEMDVREMCEEMDEDDYKTAINHYDCFSYLRSKEG